MKHCLNKRDHYNAQSQINEQEIEPEKLQKKCRLTSKQLSLTSYAGWRPDVELPIVKVIPWDMHVDWSYLLDAKTNPDL